MGSARQTAPQHARCTLHAAPLSSARLQEDVPCSRVILTAELAILPRHRMHQYLPSLLLLALALLLVVQCSPSPGHMQHKYYQEQERAIQRASRKAEWGNYRSEATVGQSSLAALLTLLAWHLLA